MKKLSAFFLLNSLFLTSDVRADNPPDFLVEAKFGLNVRQEPNQAGIIITTLPYGTFIEVIRRQEDETTIDGMHGHWAEIKAGNYQGWAFDAYLSPATLGAFIPRRIGTVTGKEYSIGVFCQGETMSEFSEVVTLAETNSVTLIHRGTGAVGPLLNSFHCPVCPKLKRQYVGIYSTCTVTAEGTYSQDPATVRVSLHRITIKSTFDPDICTITEASAAPVTTNFEIVFQKGLCLIGKNQAEAIYAPNYSLQIFTLKQISH